MDLWQKLIKDGKKASAQKQYQIADTKFRRALERSKFLYYRSRNRNESIDCITQSYLLLSQNLIRNGSVEPACNYLSHGYQFFNSLSLLISTYHAEIDGSNTTVRLSTAKSNISTAFSKIIEENSETNISHECYLRIFETQKHFNGSYSVN